MALLIPSTTFVMLIILMLHCVNAQPSVDYYPSSRLRPLKGFYHGYNNLWGSNHMWVSNDQSAVSMWLDKSSGSGFKSTRPFRNGYFGAYIKLQSGYTAGVITAFYLSNDQAHPGRHDEVDIEFMGTIPGKPYRLQTNIYVKGTGDRRIVGREMKFHLWFDPTADFHHYAILWNPEEIIFFVDDIPIRQYKKKSVDTYPSRPMWMYGSIWDASPWATDNGKYRVNFRYAPFVAKFNKFTIRGCSAFAPQYCRPVASSLFGTGLSSRQYAAMQWAQANWMVYYYCKDPKRDHSLTPECWS